MRKDDRARSREKSEGKKMCAADVEARSRGAAEKRDEKKRESAGRRVVNTALRVKLDAFGLAAASRVSGSFVYVFN